MVFNIFRNRINEDGFNALRFTKCLKQASSVIKLVHKPERESIKREQPMNQVENDPGHRVSFIVKDGGIN